MLIPQTRVDYVSTANPVPFTIPVTQYDLPAARRIDLTPAPMTAMGMAVAPAVSQTEVAKTNVIFAASRAEAASMIAFLGLDETWTAEPIGSGGYGRRFGKCLVLWSGSLSKLTFAQAVDWINTCVKTRSDEVLVL